MKIEETLFASKYSLRVHLSSLDVHTHSAMQTFTREELAQKLAAFLNQFNSELELANAPQPKLAE